MQNKKAGNFTPNIHRTDYKLDYDKYRITADSLITIDGRNITSLNGEWSFVADPYETCLRSTWFNEKKTDADGRAIPYDYDFDSAEKIQVPSCWNMVKPEYFLYENMGVYIRNFSYENEKKEERIFLHFEGASYRTYIFLNGNPIAMHDGGSTPFSVEVTENIKTENRLIVAVDASRSSSRVPMDNTDWFNYGGIYRDVLLIRTPETYIQDWFVRLVPDSDFKKIALDFKIEGNCTKTAIFTIPELQIKKTVYLEGNKGSLEFPAAPELWSPENPKLYTVFLQYGEDIISDKIGFREIKIKDQNILINGIPRFLKGMSVHEDHYQLGKCTNENVIRSTIKNLKELNGFYLRLAHYPHTRLFAKIADEMGVVLWEEIPVYWAIDFANEKTYQDAENQLCELIKRDKNRASVIIWSVGNENPDTDERYLFMSNLAKKVHLLDTTRAVSAACLVNTEKKMIQDRLIENLDIIGLNEYYGWYEPDFNELKVLLNNSTPSKPVIITEFGGGARAGNHGTPSQMWTEEFQEALYKMQFSIIKEYPYIKGLTPWILYDFRAVRRLNRYQNGFNRKGLIDSDRITKKKAFAVISDFYKTK